MVKAIYDYELFDNQEEVNTKLNNADDTKLFICTEDRQGGNWAVGNILTEKGWIERAIDWAYADDYETFDFFGNTAEETINMIDDWWNISIVKYDPNNQEHKELKYSNY